MLTPQDRLLDETGYESDVLREAARRLNFIGVLAVRYKPPELLQFLADLAQGLKRFEGSLQRKEQTGRETSGCAWIKPLP